MGTGQQSGSQICLALSEGQTTGEPLWSGPLIMPGISDFQIADLYPSPAGVIVTGKAESRGFIAGVDADTGSVRYNRTMFSLTEGYINSPPQHAGGLGTFISPPY